MALRPFIIDTTVGIVRLSPNGRLSQHFDGFGMQSKVSWHYTSSWARSLKKNDSPYAKKLLGALEVLVSGASWPQERISQAYTGEQNVCQLCGHSPCDSLHTLWTCPCIAGFDDPAVTNSEHLIPLASNEGHQYPCLWFRGILPLPLAQPTSIEAPVPDTFIPHYYLVAPDAGSWPSGSYFGDAGGGRHNLYPSLRRVGIGVAHLNQLDHSFLFGVGSPLSENTRLFTEGKLLQHCFLSSILPMTHLLTFMAMMPALLTPSTRVMIFAEGA